jgi:carbon-monoxide dehydrogenase large subunit
VTFADGFYRAGEAAVALWIVAERASLDVTTKVDVAPTYPNGCHFAEVEIDPRTGEAAVVRYGALDDVGNAIHPDAVAGQLRGGVAQGIGQALMEAVVHDSAGQLLTGSFMDYPLPRATDIPTIEAGEFHGAPCATNPLGVKGAGEGGTTGALAPIMIAINDALVQAGAQPVGMPATPARVWWSLHQAGKEQRDGGKSDEKR